MKTSFLILTTILFFSCNNPYKDYQNSVSDYQIIPKPVSLEMTNGRFLVDSKTKVVGASILENEGIILQTC